MTDERIEQARKELYWTLQGARSHMQGVREAAEAFAKYDALITEAISTERDEALAERDRAYKLRDGFKDAAARLASEEQATRDNFLPYMDEADARAAEAIASRDALLTAAKAAYDAVVRMERESRVGSRDIDNFPASYQISVTAREELLEAAWTIEPLVPSELAPSQTSADEVVGAEREFTQ